MVLYNGDRVCFKSLKTHQLRFGRVQTYVDEPATPPEELFSEHSISMDVLNRNLTKSLETKLMRIINPPQNTEAETTSEKTTPRLPGYASPMVKSKSNPDLRQDDSSNGSTWFSNLKRQIIWDDNRGETKVPRTDERFYKVVDRKFLVGQRVIYDGHCGKVTEIIPVATVRIMDEEDKQFPNKYKTPNLLTNIDVSQVRPMTSLFYGVNIEFMGWIGQISEVNRRITYKLEDGSRVSPTFHDSLIIREFVPSTSSSAKSSSSSSSKLFGYPFHPNSDLPYEGAEVTLTQSRLQQFRKEEEEDKENNENFAYSDSISSSSSNASGVPGDFIKAKVECVSIVSITVRWTGRLPAHLIKLCCADEKVKGKRVAFYSTSMPPTILRGEDLSFIQPLYIHPAMYFDKRGLCLCKMSSVGEETETVSERQWARELYKSLGKEKKGNDDHDEQASFNSSAVAVASSSQGKDSSTLEDDAAVGGVLGKRKRSCHDDAEEKNVREEREDVVVCKHFVRHMYKVIWEKKSQQQKKSDVKSYITPLPGRESSLYYGSELDPDLTQEHKLCLGLIHSHLYVVPKKGTWIDGKSWDYGVVTDKPSHNSVVVEWMKINWEDGSVNVASILKCELVEIDKHPTFNELHEGRTVVRTKRAESFKMAQDFRYGTVVSVHRFSLGQISVYCPVEQKVLELWPHMLELFVGMSMQELIARKLVGLRRNESSCPVEF
ncbi:unnamed protein product [Orchesella dallaii]|uniref:Uncharacterized protein n=1 Tax=Orchesella dallaii TaxID=48710 RepID=A0ABP1Q9Q3_9HEXA